MKRVYTKVPQGRAGRFVRWPVRATRANHFKRAADTTSKYFQYFRRVDITSKYIKWSDKGVCTAKYLKMCCISTIFWGGELRVWNISRMAPRAIYPNYSYQTGVGSIRPVNPTWQKDISLYELCFCPQKVSWFQLSAAKKTRQTHHTRNLRNSHKLCVPKISRTVKHLNSPVVYFTRLINGDT